MELIKLKEYHIVAFRLDSGENLNAFMEEHLKANGAGFVWLHGFQAQIDSAKLGFWNPKKQTYRYLNIRPQGYSQLEPITVSGNATWVNGSPFAHIHGAVCHADPRKKGRFAGGGHISEMIVGRTCEGLLLVSDNVVIERVLNPKPKCNVKEWHFPPHD